MKWVRNALLTIGTMAGLTTCLVAFFYALQLKGFQEKAKPVPQKLQVRELLEKGPGDNLHVELTDFVFGKPSIEANKGQWQAVWLPMKAKNPNPDNPRVLVLRTTIPQTKNQLDIFLKQSTVKGIVALGLPEASPWGVNPDSTPLQLNLPAKHVVFVSDVEPTLPGGFRVPSDIFFNPQAPLYGWGLTIGGALLSCICVVVLWETRDSKPRLPKRRHAPLPKPEVHAALRNERPLSTHESTTGLFTANGLNKLGIAIVGVGAVGVAVWLITASIRWNSLGLAILALIFGVMFSMLAVIGAFLALDAFRNGARSIDICRSGLRWQRGNRVHVAAWNDIANVYRVDSTIVVNGQVNETKTLELLFYDGRRLKFAVDTISDYAYFADQVQTTHGSIMAKAKYQELQKHGEAEFGRMVSVRRDGLVLQGSLHKWSNVYSHTVENGHLVIQLRSTMFDPEKKIPLMHIPNYVALLSLLQNMRDILPSQGSPALMCQ